MVDLLLFCLAVAGLTDILVQSRIRQIVLDSWWYRPIRGFFARILPDYVYEALECHQCTGTWVGFVMGYLLLGHDWVTVLACGFAGSCVARVTGALANCLDLWYLNNDHVIVDAPDE